MTVVALFDIAFLETLPGRTIEPAEVDCHGAVRSGPLTLYGRSPYAHSICVQPHEEKRKPFTVGLVRVRVRVRTTPKKATLELCDLGYGIAPHDVIDEGLIPTPDYHVLWPGKPTTNTMWTAVEDYTWFEAFSEEGRASHTCTAYAK